MKSLTCNKSGCSCSVCSWGSTWPKAIYPAVSLFAHRQWMHPGIVTPARHRMVFPSRDYFWNFRNFCRVALGQTTSIFPTGKRAREGAAPAASGAELQQRLWAVSQPGHRAPPRHATKAQQALCILPRQLRSKSIGVLCFLSANFPSCSSNCICIQTSQSYFDLVQLIYFFLFFPSSLIQFHVQVSPTHVTTVEKRPKNSWEHARSRLAGLIRLLSMAPPVRIS